MTGETISTAALLRLLQLASPSLPIGAYSYSQGLEAAIDAGFVTDEASARSWIADCLELAIARVDAPVLVRLIDAWRARDAARIADWSAYYVASRDTAEFRAETLQMGTSLAKLVRELGVCDPAAEAILAALPEIPLPCAYACAVALLDLPREAALAAYLFSWAENQVLAAMKTVPLGQVAGQRILFSLADPIRAAQRSAAVLPDDEIGSWTPGLSILGMRHETQYSRLFRS